MKRLWLLALIVVPGMAAAQKTTPMGTWGPVSRSANDMARSLDDKLNNLSKISCEYTWLFDWKTFGRGQMMGRLKVRDPKHFMFEYPRVSTKESEGLLRGTFIGNGSKSSNRFLDRKLKVTSASTVRKVPKDVLGAWPLNGPRLVLEAIGGSTRPFSALLANARAKGLSVKGESRMIELRGRKFVNHRILITRPGAKGVTDLLYEVILDVKRGLPVTMNTYRGNGTKTQRSIFRADWNLDPRQKFADSEFSLNRRLEQ